MPNAKSSNQALSWNGDVTDKLKAIGLQPIAAISLIATAIDLYAMSCGFVFFKKCIPSTEASTEVTIFFLDSKTAQSSPGGMITPFSL